MLLVADIGNSNICFGAFDGAELTHSWRVETVRTRTSDEYGLIVEALLAGKGIPVSSIRSSIIASVVPALTSTIERLFRQLLGRPPFVVGPGLKTGVSIHYDPPQDVGADRIVNAVAAYRRVGSACIVVDFGTATTFDCIAHDGSYRGGAIAPGIQVSMNALAQSTAKLPKVDFAKPEGPIGRNTVGAIQAGAYYGYIGLVEGLVVRMRDALQAPHAPVLATGGLAPLIAQETHIVDLVDEYLTLEGLRIVHDLNYPHPAKGPSHE
jgi:type III pantothenate kinase